MKHTLLSTVIFGILAATSLSAQTPSTPAPRAKLPPNPTHSPAQNASAAEKYFCDVELVDQNSEKLHFYSDLLH